MTQKQLDELSLEVDGKKFTPSFTYENYFIDEKTGEEIYEGLVITKSAEEVYQDYLNQEPNETNNLPSTEEQIANLQDLIIELSNTLF